MRRFTPVLTLAVLAGVGLFPPVCPAAAVADPPRVTPGEILVIGARASAAGSRPSVPSGAAVSAPLEAPGAVSTLARRHGLGLREHRPLFRTRRGREAFPGGAWVLRLETAEDPAEAARRLREDPAVAYAGPNHVFVPTRAGGDSLLDQQWALDSARVTEAWAATEGEGVLVAVIDTGVEWHHPDLQANIHLNAVERDGVPGVDDDGNGYVDDILGYDFSDAPGLPGSGDYLDRDPDPDDETGHGTAVAGVVAAVKDNGIGIAGVAPRARILAVRAGFSTTLPFLPGLLQEDDAAAAILYAVDRGAHILNLSWGTDVDAPVIRQAIRYARRQGVLVMAGAGNDPLDFAFYPAAQAGVVSVGAINPDGSRASFSTFGEDLDLLAPGVDILTTALDGGYERVGGTSFACPMAAGTAALVWSLFPGWTADQVAWRLRISALGASEGWNRDRGYGLLDAAAAVAAAESPPVVQPERVEARGDTLVVHGTVTDRDLAGWTLTLNPPDAATVAPEPVTLVSGASRQALAESLAVHAGAPLASGDWVARLTASRAGSPALEKRLRFTVPPVVLDHQGLGIERQVSARDVTAYFPRSSWDVLVTWVSETPYRGAVRFAPGTAGERLVEEINEGHHHVVRVPGPLPVGTTGMQTLGRPASGPAYEVLAERTIVVPRPDLEFDARPLADPPPGTPMERVADWNGNGHPEVFLETTPFEGFYGTVRLYDLPGAEAAPVEIGSSEGLFTGIPMDAGDADGDGLLELVVFRLGTWSVWEASAPGGFPDRRIFEIEQDGSVPLRFLPAGSGQVLTAITDHALEVYVPEGGGFGLASQAVTDADFLRAPGAVGDLDGDGDLDLVLADSRGDLYRFTLDGSTASFGGSYTPPLPVAGDMLAVVGEAGRDDLLTLEVDRRGLAFEGGMDRSAVRVRRWAWTGDTFALRDSVAFAGLVSESQLQLRPWGLGALLMRSEHVDLLDTREGRVEWAGALPAPTALPEIHGAAVVDVEDGAPVLWRGTSFPDAPGGEWHQVRLLNESFTAAAPGLRVVAAAVVESALEITLAWEEDGCESPPGLNAFSTLSGGYRVEASGRRAQDAVALGDTVSYELAPLHCEARMVRVAGRAPQPVAPRWGDGESLELELAEPLTAAPEAVLLRIDGALVPAPSFQTDRGGRRVLVGTNGRWPDSLVVVGAWDTGGLPLGGAYRSAAAVPEPGPDPRYPILAEVQHEAGGDNGALQVTMGGGPFSPSCSRPFRLDPPGWDLEALPAPGLPGAPLVLMLPLPEPLTAGEYTLSLRPECLDGRTGPGQERSVRIELAVYPNPLPAGRPLVVRNSEPGSLIQVIDVRGQEQVSWRTTTAREERDLDLAPGLYLLRLETPGGAVTVSKLAVVR